MFDAAQVLERIRKESYTEHEYSRHIHKEFNKVFQLGIIAGTSYSAIGIISVWMIIQAMEMLS
jgi:hypothetical protein